MKKIRLWVADDHVVVRNGLRQIAAATLDLTVIGESQDGTDTLKAVRRKDIDIDVLLLDISMPAGGIDLIPCLLQEQPSLRVLVLTMHAEPQIAARAVKAGASGYVTKDANVEVLLNAVRIVAGGGHFMEPRLADALLFERVGSNEPPPSVLTQREREILERLASAENIADIAASLGCSAKTVSVHKSRLMRKLNIKTNIELFQYAMRHCLYRT
jgi:DNA-binding NarL/FixJ family response regulator